jgi:hypothetical protein
MKRVALLSLAVLLAFVVAVRAADSVTGTAVAHPSGGIGEDYISASGTYSLPQNAMSIEMWLATFDDDNNLTIGNITYNNGSWSGSVFIGWADPGKYSTEVMVRYTINGKQIDPEHFWLNDVTFP